MILQLCARLEGGLKKIAEAQVQLDDLNAKLVVQKGAVKEFNTNSVFLLTLLMKTYIPILLNIWLLILHSCNDLNMHSA